MRKGGEKKSQGNAPGETAESVEAEDRAAPASDDAAGDESSADHKTGSLGAKNDLESLGEQLARSLEKPAPQQDPAPPEIKATPEDILGLQAQSIESKDEPAVSPPVDNSVAAKASAPSGASPKQGYEEHAAMANEVLRAHSDQPRNAGTPQEVEAETAESPSDEETAEVVESQGGDVRYSEDMTISAKRRPRRKLFGR